MKGKENEDVLKTKEIASETAEQTSETAKEAIKKDKSGAEAKQDNIVKEDKKTAIPPSPGDINKNATEEPQVKLQIETEKIKTETIDMKILEEKPEEPNETKIFINIENSSKSDINNNSVTSDDSGISASDISPTPETSDSGSMLTTSEDGNHSPSDAEVENFTDNIEKRNKNRLKEIISTMKKYKLVECLITGKHPENLRIAFEELGPTFVKMGQILSTRPDLIPENFINELKKLQDNVKSDDFTTVKKTIETSFKEPLEEIFDNFSETPLASASMAQVHLANLKDGTKVVVKVQHDKIKELMLNDVALFEKAIPFFKYVPGGKLVDPAGMIKELKDACEKELNFILESKNIQIFFHNNSELEYMKCLKSYPDYTKENILVMEYVIGTKIDNVEALKKEGVDVKALAQNLVNNYMKQAFEDGFFHADPHPGNILIREKKITFLDFGMMGTMDSAMLKKFNDLLYALYINDTKELSSAVMRLCRKNGKVDKEKLNNDIDDFYYQYIDGVALNEMKFPVIITKLKDVCMGNNLGIPEDILMFARGFMTIEGVIQNLDSDLTLMSALEPYMKNYISTRFNLANEIKEYGKSLYKMGKTVPEIPVKIAQTLDKLKDGEFKMQIQHDNLDKTFKELDYIVNKIVVGLLLFALIVGSSILANTGNLVEGHNLMSSIGVIGYVIAAIFTLLLIFSIIRNKK